MGIPSFGQLAWASAAGTRSKPLTIHGVTVCGFFIPSGFAGTTLTFEVSAGDGTYVPLCDNTGAAISYTVAAGKYIRALPADFAGITHIQAVSGSSEAANTVIKLALREIA